MKDSTMIENTKMLCKAAFAAMMASAGVFCLSAPASAKVGVASAVNQAAKGQQPGGAAKLISIGKNVIFNERITTDAGGLVQILLLDGTTFTVGPNSSMVIDRFVYNPADGSAEVTATVVKGAFRFVGGLASRKKDATTINTPTGTMGIRGAMVEGDIAGAGGQSIISMIFGNDVTFTSNGGKKTRLYEAGYTMEISNGGSSTRVRRRTASDARTFQTALAGAKGKSGGASQKPTDTIVANSAITEVNSGAPVNVTTPTPRPRPVRSSTIEESETEIADIEIAAQDIVREDVAEIKVPVPRARPKIRVRTAPDVYEATFGGERYGQAGGRGLVGSTPPNTDFTVEIDKAGDRIVSTTAGSEIDLPDVSGTEGDGGLESIAVMDGLLRNSIPLTGTAYAGAGDFVAYALQQNSNPNDPVYVISGTPTDLANLAAFDSGTSIRQYSLASDPVRPSPVAFFAPEFYGQPTNFNASNFILVEPSGSTTGEVESFYTWLDITGSGLNQKSAALLHTSAVFTNSEGVTYLSGSRRGGMRPSAMLGSFNFRGNVGTLEGADRSHVFGENAEHFVVGNRSDVNAYDAHFDGAVAPEQFGMNFDLENGGYTDSGHFGSFHVASLIAENEQAGFSRTSRSVRGFGVGIVEPATEGPQNAFGVFAGTPGSTTIQGANPNLLLDIFAENNTVSAALTPGDNYGLSPIVSSYFLSFGARGESNGGNTFVDDNTFGAVDTNDNSATRLLTDDGQNLSNDGSNPGSYLISGRATPVAGYEHCTSCSFADWGWWGTRVTVTNDGTIADAVHGRRADFVHLGTWVAGDITKAADLPTLETATFSGTALGSIVKTGVENGTFVARGDVSMDFDFASRQGQLNISNFGGLNASGAVGQVSNSPDALFAGSLAGLAGENGEASGAFVNGNGRVAEGVIGQFSIRQQIESDGGSQQTLGLGTFVGSR